MRMEDDMDAPCGVDLVCDEGLTRDSDDFEEEVEDIEDEAVEEEEEKEEEDENVNDGKEPRTIGQGEIVTTSADNVDAMIVNQPIMIPEQGQEMEKHTPGPQLPEPAPWPETPQPCPPPQTPEIHPLTWLESFGLVMAQICCAGLPAPQGSEGARITLDVNVNQ